MKRILAQAKVTALMALMLALLIGVVVGAAQEDATDEPETLIEGASEPFEVMFGSGPFDLRSTTQGLSELASYRATLTVSFDGMSEGQPQQWARTYTLLVTQSPPARQLLIENPEDSSVQVYRAVVDNTYYERRDGNPCIAREIGSLGAVAESWEPASFLDSVIGADESGTETVNNVATNRYTFDEHAQGMLGSAESTGALWVASEGGYLVRYLLTTTAGPEYFGESTEGTLTWDYQLNDVNQPLVIAIPEDCPPPLLDLPIMPDAAGIVQTPGLTSYMTAATVREVAAFYEEQMSAQGAQPANPPLVTESSTPFIGTSATALWGFTWSNQPILLIASSDGDTTRVQLQQMPDPADLSFAAEVPEIVIAPEDTLGDCAAGGTPILADAFDVITLPGGLNYMTSASVEDAAAFYQEQFTALGADVSSPATIAGITRLEATRGFHRIDVTLLPEGTSVRVTLASPSGSPVTPATTCNQAAAAECLADGIPVIAGTINLQDVMGMLAYSTDLSVPEVVAFYEDQIGTRGGQVSSMMPATDQMAMLDVRQGNQSLMVMIGASGTMTTVNITSLTGSPLPPPTMCMSGAPAAAEAQPTAPQTDAASGSPGAACTVSTASGANQRSGPGTDFDLAGTLSAGVNASVDGQATGADGFVWWRLGEGVWVRSDVVDESGNCEGVSVVQP